MKTAALALLLAGCLPDGGPLEDPAHMSWTMHNLCSSPLPVILVGDSQSWPEWLIAPSSTDTLDITCAPGELVHAQWPGGHGPDRTCGRDASNVGTVSCDAL